MIISNLVYIYYLQYIIKLLIYSIYKKYFKSIEILKKCDIIFEN